MPFDITTARPMSDKDYADAIFKARQLKIPSAFRQREPGLEPPMFSPDDLIGAGVISKFALAVKALTASAAKSGLAVGMVGALKSKGTKPMQDLIVRQEGGTAMSVKKQVKPQGRWSDSLSPDATEAEKLSAYSDHIKAIEQYNIDRANELIGMLDKHGIKTSGTGVQESPFTSTTNAVGGASLYMKVPGYGTIRFSDHVKTGIGGSMDKNFKDAQSAYDAIRGAISERAARHREVQSLRDEIGIGDNPQANIDAIKKWLKENPQPEGLNKPFAWKDRLLLTPGQPGSWLPNRLDTYNPFESAKTEFELANEVAQRNAASPLLDILETKKKD